MSDSWYFAYGSNLSVDRKSLRTGEIRRAVRCRLPGYRLSFNKRAHAGGVFANIVADERSEVWGVVYLCDQGAIAALDSYEGVTSGHYRHAYVKIATDDDGEFTALTYVAGDDWVCVEGRPNAGYLEAIITGAREHGLPDGYVARLEALRCDDVAKA